MNVKLKVNTNLFLSTEFKLLDEFGDGRVINVNGRLIADKPVKL